MFGLTYTQLKVKISSRTQRIFILTVLIEVAKQINQSLKHIIFLEKAKGESNALIQNNSKLAGLLCNKCVVLTYALFCIDMTAYAISNTKFDISFSWI